MVERFLIPLTVEEKAFVIADIYNTRTISVQHFIDSQEELPELVLNMSLARNRVTASLRTNLTEDDFWLGEDETNEIMGELLELIINTHHFFPREIIA